MNEVLLRSSGRKQLISRARAAKTMCLTLRASAPPEVLAHPVTPDLMPSTHRTDLIQEAPARAAAVVSHPSDLREHRARER